MGGMTWSSNFMLVRFHIFLMIPLSSSLACSKFPDHHRHKPRKTTMTQMAVLQRSALRSAVLSSGGTLTICCWGWDGVQLRGQRSHQRGRRSALWSLLQTGPETMPPEGRWCRAEVPAAVSSCCVWSVLWGMESQPGALIWWTVWYSTPEEWWVISKFHLFKLFTDGKIASNQSWYQLLLSCRRFRVPQSRNLHQAVLTP